MSDLKNWDLIQKKLQREKKSDLIQLIQELTAVSDEAQRYIQVRYLKQKSTSDRVAPYRQVIQEQFVISEWNHTVTYSFAGVQKAIDDYAQSSDGDEVGLCELMVFALETAVKFADSINLQADDFDEDVTELGEQCVDHLTTHRHLYSSVKRRIQKVKQMASATGYYGLDEHLDELIYRSSESDE